MLKSYWWGGNEQSAMWWVSSRLCGGWPMWLSCQPKVQILLFFFFWGDFYSTWGPVGTRTWTRAWQYFPNVFQWIIKVTFSPTSFSHFVTFLKAFLCLALSLTRLSAPPNYCHEAPSESQSSYFILAHSSLSLVLTNLYSKQLTPGIILLMLSGLIFIQISEINI